MKSDKALEGEQINEGQSDCDGCVMQYSQLQAAKKATIFARQQCLHQFLLLDSGVLVRYVPV